MLRHLYPKINWDEIKLIGLDMDGTLYDEFDFISQVYRAISEPVASISGIDSSDIYDFMIKRWKEKGSSYPYIFDEALSMTNISQELRHDMIRRSLEIFRNYKPKIHLCAEVRELLDLLITHAPLFLVTDGSASLQAAKIDSLNLHEWICKENIGISGVFGLDFYKPNTRILDKIEITRLVAPENVIYFGDRDKDQAFAKNAGFKFQPVRLMQPSEI